MPCRRFLELSLMQVGMTKTDAAMQTLQGINPDVALEVRGESEGTPGASRLGGLWAAALAVCKAKDHRVQ